MRGYHQGVGPNTKKISSTDAAATKIKSKAYLGKYNEQQLRRACELLDSDLMVAPGYDEDCAVGTGIGASSP
jgi:hypothetical protein